jgi:hypothetical protein
MCNYDEEFNRSMIQSSDKDDLLTRFIFDKSWLRGLRD